MGRDDFMTAATNRSVRSIKTELAFLTDAAVISQDTLASILAQLPQEESVHAPVPLQSGPVAAKMANLSVNGHGGSNGAGNHSNTNGMVDASNEKTGFGHSPVQSPEQPPPAYPANQAPLTYATALYAYTPTDAGDLALSANDKVAVTEYMNAEWWKGRSDRTGQEGIFPRSYVRVDEKQIPAQTGTYYGNVPLDVSQGHSGEASSGPSGPPSKFQEGGKKFGKKLGNAAVFGAGATLGGKIVNGIF